MDSRVFPVHNNKFRIGINGLDSADKDMVTIKDLDNFSLSIDNTIEEWYAMDAGGWAKAMPTAKKLSISLSGKRSLGDPGNDYVAEKAFSMGNELMTKFEWEMVSGAKLTFECVLNVTTPGGGDSTALDSIEFEAICYGKPSFIQAPTL